jgi:rhodanese-related sulfurtransferase
VALALRKLGIMRVHPLADGLEGWNERSFPVTPLEEVAQPSA